MIGVLSSAQNNAGASPSPSFSPADLFANGEDGAWYDPSDLSTLWKDTAGTIPVTSDGDLVARIDDKSGNENHLTQPTSGMRPLYKTNGTLHWLLFDGTDDALWGSGFVCTGTDSFSGVISVVNLSNAQDGDRAVSFGDSSGVGGKVIGLALDADGASYRYNNGARAFKEAWTSPVDPYILTLGRDNGDDYGGSDVIRKNASELSQTAVNNSSNTTSAMVGEEIIIGSGRSGVGAFGAHAEMKFYGAVLVGPKLSTENRDSAEQWLASTSGVTI